MKIGHIVDHPKTRIKPQVLERFLTDNCHQVVQALEHYGFEVRIVGGAIRDLLSGQDPRDIDLATDALPDQIIWIMQQHDFPITTKGITHGTIKVVFSEEEEYEITSLDFRIKLDDGKLVVEHAKDWRRDALRRDFTINSMSMDLKGNVYDYVDGLSDLHLHKIKFIGDSSNKIENDPVLILRFFKLLSKFVNPIYDDKTLLLIKRYKHLLTQIKQKRVDLELGNIHGGKNAKEALHLMCKLGIDKIIQIPCSE